MSDLKTKLNAIMHDIEENIKNKDDLEYIKSQIYNISLLFLDEMDKLAEINLKKLNILTDKEKQLAKKVTSMEKALEHLQKEIFVETDYDFEIVCPYCNEEFVANFSEGIKGEVRCPECNNIIELDWHDDCCECGSEHDNEGECDDCCDCEDRCTCNDEGDCDGGCTCDDDCDDEDM